MIETIRTVDVQRAVDGSAGLSITNSTFSGTYRVNGGCASGDEGNVTGINIPYIANNLSGSFTSSTQGTFNVTGDIGQSGGASSTGSFEISGTVTFDTPCFSSGTIKPGAFPSASYILGTTVAFEFDTSNGILAFLGTLNQDRNKIQGNYTISGGTCSDSGSAVLGITSPWDY